MPRLEITPEEDGVLDVHGILSDGLQIRDENGNATNGLDFVPKERRPPLGRTVDTFLAYAIGAM
jgi:hypothetical protein